MVTKVQINIDENLLNQAIEYFKESGLDEGDSIYDAILAKAIADHRLLAQLLSEQ
jgi:Arc/MetJ family transcription regulator